MRNGKHVDPARRPPATAAGVFVDATGRRARWLQRGLRVVVLCAAVAVTLIVVSLVGGVPLPGLTRPVTLPSDEPARQGQAVAVAEPTPGRHARPDRSSTDRREAGPRAVEGIVGSRTGTSSSTIGTSAPQSSGSSTIGSTGPGTGGPHAPASSPGSTTSSAPPKRAPASSAAPTAPSTAPSTTPSSSNGGPPPGRPRNTRARTVGSTPTPGPKSTHPGGGRGSTTPGSGRRSTHPGGGPKSSNTHKPTVAASSHAHSATATEIVAS